MLHREATKRKASISTKIHSITSKKSSFAHHDKPSKQTWNRSQKVTAAVVSAVVLFVFLAVNHLPPTTESKINAADDKVHMKAAEAMDGSEFTYLSSNVNGASFNLTRYLSRIEYWPMHLYPQEIKVFIEEVQGKDTYLEWGSGGSTEVAPFLVNKHVYSIEHAIPWCKRMVTELHVIHVAVSFNKLSFHCVDTMIELGKWGRPKTNDTNQIARMGDIYVNYIDRLRATTFDVFFIDGRFRVACALKIIHGQYYHTDSVVMIHDYANRIEDDEDWHYKIVETYYDKVKCARRLCVFRVKADIDRQQLKHDLNKYQLEWQ